MTMNNLYFTIGAILLFGALGGLINKFRDTENISTYVKSIIKGIGAAVLVPLFLALVQSDIIDTTKQDLQQFMLFGGLCLITAIFSDKFFDSIGAKVMAQVKEAKTIAKKADEKAENAETIAREAEESNQEFDVADDVLFNIKEARWQEGTESKIKKVAKSIIESKFSYRTVGGIANDTGIPRSELTDLLNGMQEKGMAKKKINRKGNDIWKIVII